MEINIGWFKKISAEKPEMKKIPLTFEPIFAVELFSLLDIDN